MRNVLVEYGIKKIILYNKMPENTVDEFQGKNKYGHRSRSDRRNQRGRHRSSSPPKKIGNIQSHRNYCTHCAPSLASNLEKKFGIVEDLKEIKKEIKELTAKETIDVLVDDKN